MAEEFLERYRKMSEDEKIIVFADDYCWIIEEKIGEWLMHLLEGMENTKADLMNVTGLPGGEYRNRRALILAFISMAKAIGYRFVSL